jgi:predicted phage terminase large subunit-like protein
MASLDIKLLSWQQKVWADPTRFKVVAAGRRTGKSRLAAYLLLVNALQCDKGHVWYIANTQGQARDVLWQVLLEAGHSVIESSHVNNMQIRLVNGSTITLKGADRPETMRGVSLKFVVLDEYGSMKPEVWEQIIRPALADQKGAALFIGTPLGRNHFYDLYQYADLGKDSDYKAWHFTSFDNELLDPKEIEAAKTSMSSFAFRQEFMASFEAAQSDIFKADWLKVEDKDDEPRDGQYYIAVDLAGFEEVGKQASNKKKHLDESAIAVVKIHQEGWWIDHIEVGRWDVKNTADKIIKICKEYDVKVVGIERGMAKNAVLPYLQDLMRRYGYYISVIDLTHGNKKKTDRIVWALQGRFEHGRIKLKRAEWNKQFIDQLLNFPSTGVHDDMLDAVAYVDQIGITEFTDVLDEEEEYQPLDPISAY